MKNDEVDLVREWENPNRFKQLAIKAFFAIGERLALIVLLIAAVIVLSIQNSDVAFSEKKPERITVEYINIPTETPTPIPPTPTPIPPTPTPTETPTPTPTAAPTPTPVPVD